MDGWWALADAIRNELLATTTTDDLGGCTTEEEEGTMMRNSENHGGRVVRRRVCAFRDTGSTRSAAPPVRRGEGLAGNATEETQTTK